MLLLKVTHIFSDKTGTLTANKMSLSLASTGSTLITCDTKLDEYIHSNNNNYHEKDNNNQEIINSNVVNDNTNTDSSNNTMTSERPDIGSCTVESILSSKNKHTISLLSLASNYISLLHREIENGKRAKKQKKLASSSHSMFHMQPHTTSAAQKANIRDWL